MKAGSDLFRMMIDGRKLVLAVADITLPLLLWSTNERTSSGIFLFWSGLMVLGWMTLAP
jgi:hypothetical protein